jgi:hypothetical protein
MARTTGPLMSFDASGSLAGTLVFSKWKGRPYVRQLVTPANPNSETQVSVRAMMRFLSQTWAAIVSMNQATWEPQAQAGSFSPFNAYTKTNLIGWKENKAPSEMYPATRAGTLATTPAIAATGFTRYASIQYTQGGITVNWGLILCRSLTMGFTPSFANTIRVLDITAGTTVNYDDTGLAPNTYYYNGYIFTADGNMSAALGETSAVVT